MEAHAIRVPATGVAHASAPEAPATGIGRERIVGWLFAGTGLALFAVMGLLGLTMRLTQADAIGVSPSWFYRIMTLHGAGMLAGALLAMMGALWFVLREHAPLSMSRVLWSYAGIVGGAVVIVVAVVAGGFATGWTFLSPLPFNAAGEWPGWAAGAFLIGMTLVGVGFFVFCIDVLSSVVGAYGSLGRALGLGVLRGTDDSPPPPQVIGATVVSLEGMLAAAAGTTVLAALLGRWVDSDVQIDALWAKNLTFFFGHSIANLIIYLAVGSVYVLVPRYAGRPWRTTKPIVIAWLATLVLVATAYSHHLYMDFVQPGFAQYVSSIASYTAAIPVAVVTIFTGMMLVWGSRYRWTLASTLLYLGFAGWAIGGMGAVLDSIIPFNFRLHNSLWVPAHFHTYLMLGVIFWLMAFLAHLLERAADRPASRFATVAAPLLMVIGGYGLVGSWYVSGALGVPRRYAVHFGDTEAYSVAGSIAVVVFAIGFLILLAAFAALGREGHARWKAGRAAGTPAPMGGADEAIPAGSNGTEGVEPPLATPIQLAAGVAAAVVSLVALFPPIVDASEASAQFHHLDHGGQFLLGALWALVIASSPTTFSRFSPTRSGAALATVILAPTVMLLAMTPSIYKPLEDQEAVHLLYHMGVVTLGLITGLAAARMGRVPGRILFFLAIAMAAMYAAGVTAG